jgi:serine protease AprX
MKFFLLAFFSMSFSFQLNAQYPKLIVQFKDKSSNTYNLNNPSQFLSQRAVERRKRYNIPIDSTDLPVTKQYKDSILGAGNVKVLSESKWLNQVLIETGDQNAINKIRSFSFVKSERGIGYRPVTKKRTDKFKKPQPLNFSGTNRPHRIEGNTYDYGNNYKQVHIHEGEFLHNKGLHGETMQIAVLDAGFMQYKTITAFDSVRINKQILGERDFVAFDNSVNEDDSHGMYCLSILCANWPGQMVGTAPAASYWLIRTENAASEYPIEEHNWVAGAEFADSSGADMISSSLGYNTFDDSSFNHTYADFYKRAAMISIGASAAVKKGMIVTNSAGNEGANGWKYIIFPADADSVCTVGAVNTAGAIANFSSYGYTGKVKPNIVSVGAGTVIAGLNNQPVSGNGTSFSNPNIAGLIACLWQAFPSDNNMKILDAVYKSADRYITPDSQYGYGIPNFRIAYQLLKHDQNTALYGNQWFFATPTPFTTKIDTKVIAQADGPAKVELINSIGQVIASHNILAEKEETYHYTFANLANVPAGFYSVKFSDSTFTQTISVQKGNIFEKDWLITIPNPFRDNLAVYLKAPESGEVTLRLIDAKGSVTEMITENVTQNEIRTIRFKSIQKLQRGAYFLQYISKSQKRIIRLIKG